MKSSSFLISYIVLLIPYIFHISAQPVEETNTFDAFTSASKALKITGGTIYKTHAVIQWLEWYKDEPHVDAYQLEWGTEPGVFTNIIDLKPFNQKTVTATAITPLTENTTYYARFYRVFEEDPEITEFYFNTPPLPNPVKTPAPILHPDRNSAKASFSLYSIDGKSLIRIDRHSSARNLCSFLNPASSGIYLIRYYSEDDKPSTARMVIKR